MLEATVGVTIQQVVKLAEQVSDYRVKSHEDFYLEEVVCAMMPKEREIRKREYEFDL